VFEGLQDASNSLLKSLSFLQSLQSEFPLQKNLDNSDSALVTYAQKLVRERKIRGMFFETGLFGEPVWDVLLDLYINDVLDKKVSVSSSCIAASVPSTTALRYLAMMTAKGMIVRTPDTNDTRVVFLSLSEKTLQKVKLYLIRSRNECG
jgi:hypothetical protein